MGKNISPWGKQCKTQMIILNKTLKELSAEIGLSATYVSAIINGRVISPVETINKISKALDIPLHDVSIPKQGVK